MIDELLADYIRQLEDQGDFVVSIAAADFVQQAMHSYRTEFEKWLEVRAEEFVQNEIRKVLHAQRNRARRLAPVTAFRGAADQYAADPDGEGRQALEAHYTVNHDNLWRRLRDMTKDDLGFVAEQYERSGKRNLLWGAYFRALQKKVGPGQVVGDVLSEAQVVEMQGRIVGDK